MKTVRFHEHGNPEVLRYEDADLPVPGAGQVRVRVAATTFNGIDANIRAGVMQGPIPVTLPHTPGLDLAGTVDALGDGVTEPRVGDDVVGFLPMTGDGASAEYVLAPAEVLTAAPSSIPLAEAAALPVVGLTAWQALFDHAGLKAGQRILVNGAGGAVGAYAVQLAKRAGAHVIATASPGSRARVTAAGADEVVDHTGTDVTAAVTEPVDVLLNLAPIDPDRFAALVGLVRDGGVIVSTTVWMPTRPTTRAECAASTCSCGATRPSSRGWSSWSTAGSCGVEVAERVPLADLPELHARAAAGKLPGGKVTVVPAAG